MILVGVWLNEYVGDTDEEVCHVISDKNKKCFSVAEEGM